METINISKQIWEEHSGKLKAFICQKVNHDDQCHDILHDVFIKITENAERIKWSEKPASYVIKMAQNAVIDHYRSMKKNVSEEIVDCTAEKDQKPAQQLADCCLLPFILKLPDTYKEALMLTELEGMSQKELAEKLNISYTGAKSRVQRARKMLKESILECCPYQFDKYGNIVGCCE